MKTITKENVSDHVDHLIDILELIQPGEITILTGSNGIGKSVIRKTVGTRIAEKLKRDENKPIVASTSMEQRTGSNPEWGALSGFMRDVGWTPTSRETLNKITKLLEIEDRFIVIDEPELGMGEELVLSLVNFLNKTIKKTDTFMGLLIITHSRIMVEHLNHDRFINIDGLNREEWLNRKIIPMDFEELETRMDALYNEILDRGKKNKKD